MSIVKYKTTAGAVALEVDSDGKLFSQLPVYTVATLPASVEGKLICVSDGAAGSFCLAVGDGTDYLRSDTLTAVAVS